MPSTAFRSPAGGGASLNDPGHSDIVGGEGVTVLTSVRCVNYRGFKDFTVNGLGRVNLVIGGNNSGKSSWLGACLSNGADVGSLPVPQATVDVYAGLRFGDRERWWTPLFRNGDEGAGLSIEVVDDDGATRSIRLGLVAPEDAKIAGPRAWWYEVTRNGVERSWFYYDGDTRYQSGPVRPSAWIWCPPVRLLSHPDHGRIRQLSVVGELDDMALPLRRFDPRIAGIELIGNDVFVQLVGHRRKLPFSVLGDGAYRILDLVLACSSSEHNIVGVDEFDGALHHTSLPIAWDILRTARPNLQIFATTHRDECVLAAARSFLEAGDDGLRVIRLDRRDDGHTYAMYTAEQALNAIESGWEIRG